MPELESPGYWNVDYWASSYWEPEYWAGPLVVVPPPPTDGWRPKKSKPLPLEFYEKRIVGQVTELRQRQEERAEIELTQQIVDATLENRRQEVADEVAAQRREANQRFDRRQTALQNLAKAQVKKEMGGTLDPEEIIRQKNLQAKRLAALKKARRAKKRKNRK